MGGDGADVALTVAGGAALFSLGCFLGARIQPEAKPQPADDADDGAATSLALEPEPEPTPWPSHISADPELEALTAFAEELADATEPIVLQYFRSRALRGAGDLKKDLSAKTAAEAAPHGDNVERAERVASYPDIVTEADKEAERVMRAMVEARYPEHAIVGEEFGVKGDPATAEWCWVFDPIDGTADFVCGTHQWGTLIALCKGGAPIIGVINQPATKDRWVGCRGAPTLHNGLPSRCAPCACLDAARLSASGSGLGALVEDDWVTSTHALVQSTRTASFGGPNAYGWGLVASGCVDVLLDASDSEIYDIAAAILVPARAASTPSACAR